MDFVKSRQEMVDSQIRSRDIVDAGVLKAMAEVPREEFLPPELRDVAYTDNPLPIGEEQTISQPYIVALMLQALELNGSEKVLEIGAGRGYQAAVLSRLCKHVYTVERLEALAHHAEQVLQKLCYMNVTVVVGDGSKGLEKNAPYDAIVVAAACSKVPSALKDQLKEGGRMVLPVGDEYSQELMKLTKKDGDFVEQKLCDCAFVPLIGEEDGQD